MGLDISLKLTFTRVSTCDDIKSFVNDVTDVLKGRNVVEKINCQVGDDKIIFDASFWSEAYIDLGGVTKKAQVIADKYEVVLIT